MDFFALFTKNSQKTIDICEKCAKLELALDELEC